MPSIPLEVVTIGRPAAKASASLMRIPEPAWSGTTTTYGES